MSNDNRPSTAHLVSVVMEAGVVFYARTDRPDGTRESEVKLSVPAQVVGQVRKGKPVVARNINTFDRLKGHRFDTPAELRKWVYYRTGYSPKFSALPVETRDAAFKALSTMAMRLAVALGNSTGGTVADVREAFNTIRTALDVYGKFDEKTDAAALAAFVKADDALDAELVGGE